MSYEELLKSLYYLDDNIIYTGIKKSIDISNQVISFDILDLTYKTPVFINNKYSTEDYIRKLCLEKIENIKEKLQAPFKYINRLEYELNILSKNKYLDFILIIKDIIDFAVANDIIIGPGRGSCCGSLVLYLLGVTKIDPIKYDLMFERFVSSGRKEKADIDIDISASKRKIIISYIIQKYGYYNCCSLINYDKRGFKGAFKDSLDLYNIDEKISDKVYNIVLKANRAVAKAAKPGMTLRELNDICKKVLAEGCIELGLIKEEKEIDKYYMHGVSHHLGIDVHDVTVASNSKLRPGAVITDEPGLYIDEWETGIRIEDDLLITEDGCEVLSEAIMRNPDEIERYMAEYHK